MIPAVQCPPTVSALQPAASLEISSTVPEPEPARKELRSVSSDKRSASPEEKKSSSPKDPKKLRKKPGATGFKSKFGTNKRKDDKEQPPMKPTGAEPSAVAAARAALEGKAKAAQESSRQTTNGSLVLKKKPVVEPAPAQETKTEPAPEPVREKPESDTRELEEVPAPACLAVFPRPSSVDTNERAAADAEFSRFDQGSLDQPAFAPDSPISQTVPETAEPEMKTPVTQTEIKPERVSTSLDQWAQIRKNAAEHAAEHAAAGEQPGHRSMDSGRTDERDTSGSAV